MIEGCQLGSHMALLNQDNLRRLYLQRTNYVRDGKVQGNYKECRNSGLFQQSSTSLKGKDGGVTQIQRERKLCNQCYPEISCDLLPQTATGGFTRINTLISLSLPSISCQGSPLDRPNRQPEYIGTPSRIYTSQPPRQKAEIREQKGDMEAQTEDIWLQVFQIMKNILLQQGVQTTLIICINRQ